MGIPSIPKINRLINYGLDANDLPSLDLQFAADKTLTARRGPTPTFSRASAATEIGPDGLIRYAPENLVTRSQETSFWTVVGASARISSDSAIAPDGTMTADIIQFTGNSGYLAAGTASVVFGPATISCWVRVSSGTALFRLQLTDTPSSDFTANTNWQRFSFYSATGFTSTYAGIRAASDGSSATLEVWGLQVERHTSARNYIPTAGSVVYGARFDHDPVTLASRGLLIEESRTNLALQSEAFQTSWTTFESSISANSTTSPSGAITADSLIENSSTNTHSVFQSCNFVGSTIYTLSVYAKAGGRNWMSVNEASTGAVRRTFFNLSTGTIGTKDAAHTASVQQLPNGWWRVSITFIAGSSGVFSIAYALAFNDNVSSYTGNGTGNVFLWGAQLELGSFPTSYIPTTTASVVRSADVCSITGSDFSGFFNQSAGTLITQSAISVIASQDRGTLQIDNGANGTQLRVNYVSAAGFVASVRNNNGAETILASAQPTASATQRLAIAYEGTSFSGVINGGNVSAVTRDMPVGLNVMRIGTLAGNFFLSGHISRISYYRKRLPNAKLQSLTT